MNKATHRYFAKSIDWTQISKDNTKWRKLRNEIMALALIWAFIIYLLKSQVQDTHELQLHQSDEF